MIRFWYLGLVVLYVGGVLVCKNSPESLLEVDAERLSVRLKRRLGTLTLGVFLLLAAGISFRLDTWNVDLTTAARWGLPPTNLFSFAEIERAFIASLLHWDLLHLFSNLIVLPFLLPYERRVGATRFLLIFVFASILIQFWEDLLPLGQVIGLGASGGICALIAAANIDRPGMEIREWTTRLVISFLLIGFVSLQGVLHAPSSSYQVDWIAHLLAVPAAALFCFLFRIGGDPAIFRLAPKLRHML